MAKAFSKHIYESSRWKKCAGAFAKSKLYICERCGKLVRPNEKNKLRYVIHHRQPLTPDNVNDDLLVYGWDNLQLLCYECHMILSTPPMTVRKIRNNIRQGRPFF